MRTREVRGDDRNMYDEYDERSEKIVQHYVTHSKLSDEERLPENLRYTLCNAIAKKYGKYSLENQQKFERYLFLSNGCLDDLQSRFFISLSDLEKVCIYLEPPVWLMFYWIQHYVIPYL